MGKPEIYAGAFYFVLMFWFAFFSPFDLTSLLAGDIIVLATAFLYVFLLPGHPR